VNVTVHIGLAAIEPSAPAGATAESAAHPRSGRSEQAYRLTLRSQVRHQDDGR
jgi:hypothetical protein